jgi:diacylglycerol kinase (ATP)
MKLNQRLIPLAHAKSRNPQPLMSLLPMSPDVSTPTSDHSTEVLKCKRTLAWQVAPNLFSSFKYAGAGLLYAFKTQRNFRIHVVIGSLALGLSLFLHVSTIEIAIIGLTVAAVLTLELLNTALESVVDLTVQQAYHELAKIAKDCAAGAVLVSALAAVFVASVILIPPLLALLFG